MRNCWLINYRRAALLKDTILLHDNVTEVTRNMYLASNPADCIFEGWAFAAGDRNVEYTEVIKRNVPNGPACHQHCVEHPACIMIQYHVDNLNCHLRNNRISKNLNSNYISGYKLCGSLYYEGENTGGSQLTTVTFAQNLESAAIALSDGVFKMKRCNVNRGRDCYVLIEYK